MKIKKVKLLDNGNKGVKITYVEQEERAGKEWLIYRDSEHTFPATPNLLSSFNMLKIHLLKLCRLWDPEQDQYLIKTSWDLVVPESMTNGYKKMQSLLSDMKVVSVTSNLEDFLITGKLRGVDNGNINLVSMNIQPETDYAYYDEVIAIINNLYQHTGSYVNDEILVEKTRIVNGDDIKEGVISLGNSQMTDEQIEAEHAEMEARTGKIITIPSDSEDEDDMPMNFNDGLDWKETPGSN